MLELYLFHFIHLLHVGNCGLFFKSLYGTSQKVLLCPHWVSTHRAHGVFIYFPGQPQHTAGVTQSAEMLPTHSILQSPCSTQLLIEEFFLKCYGHQALRRLSECSTPLTELRAFLSRRKCESAYKTDALDIAPGSRFTVFER